jgi:hypothetical protein
MKKADGVTMETLPKITVQIGNEESIYDMQKAFNAGVLEAHKTLVNLLIDANVFYTVQPWNVNQVNVDAIAEGYFQIGDLVYNHWVGDRYEIRLVSDLLEA